MGQISVKILGHFSAEINKRVADEAAGLPEEAVITEWLADYAMLRAQARACQTP